MSLLAALTLLSGCDQAMRGVASPAGASLAFDRLLDSAVPVVPAQQPPVQRPDRAPAESPAPPHSPAQPPGGSSGGVPGPQSFDLEVRDESERPLAGATVFLADGRQAESDSAGRVSLPGAFPAGVAIVSKPGYATSVVANLDAPAPLHLQRADGYREAFLARRRNIEAQVRWPSADHQGGVAYFIDSLGSGGEAVPLVGDGFTMPVTAQRDGDPTAVLFVVAVDSQNRMLIGVSRPFMTFGGEPEPIEVHVADQPIDYAMSGQPAGLNALRSRLEVHQDGAPAVVIDSVKGTSAGRFMAPGAGLLPGRLRLVVEARDDDYRATSRISLTPTAGQPLRGTFLPLPQPSLNRASGQLTWPTVPGATGYRAEVRHEIDRLAPVWEAWTGSLTSALLPADLLRSSETGQVTVEAIDDPTLTSRHIASIGAPRALRLAPWEHSLVYRLASRRVPT